MYTLAGLMVSLTVTALLVNARHERTVDEYQQYNEAMEKNEAHWAGLRDRYTLFDTLKEESSPKSMSYELLGHWQLESHSNSSRPTTLLVIDRDGQQTEFRYQRRPECYKRHKANELEYYGDANMIVKDRSRESRYHYQVTPDGKLNIEELYIEGGWGVASYARIDPRDALDIDYCDSDY